MEFPFEEWNITLYVFNGSSKQEKSLFLEKFPYKIEKISVAKYFFYNFTFGIEHFVAIDWFLVEIQEIYIFKIMFKILKTRSMFEKYRPNEKKSQLQNRFTF